MNVVVLLAAIVVFLVFAKTYGLRRLLPGIPTFRYQPFIYHIIAAQKNVHQLPAYCLQVTQELKSLTWHFVIPSGPTMVISADPAVAEWILKTNFENYEKGPEFRELLHNLLGDGIFNADGSNWKHQRQIATHLFKVKELKHMVPIIIEHGRHVLAKLEKIADTGKTINMIDVFARFTLDSIGEIGFGCNIDSQHSQAPFATAFDNSQEIASNSFLMPKFVWKYFYKQRSDPHLEVINAFARKLVEERRADPTRAERHDLLSKYMNMEDEYSYEFLRDTVLNFIIAGRDTTAQTLTWMFYLLSQNVDKQNELVSEISEAMAGANDEYPDYETLKDLKYARGAINETLRLYPPVPIDPKVAINDDVLPNGMKIPAGTMVNWTMYVMGRLPQFWEEPEQYMPERWLDPAKEKERHPYLFIPFQAGPRTCLGINMAYLEIKLMLCMLLSKYELRLAPGEMPMPKTALTLPPDSMLMTVHTRE